MTQNLHERDERDLMGRDARLYVIDDDEGVARAVARSARSIGFETQIYTSAAEFIADLDRLEHGCVVLDIRMPEINGLDLLDILKERRPAWPVIMLTGHAEVGSAVRSFRSGAVHFLGKPFRKDELLAALAEARQVGARRLRRSVDPEQAEAMRRLTAREREVLAAIAGGLQSKAIAWQLGISTRTVELHRSNILAKLCARNTSQAVAIAKACGFAEA